MSALEPDMSEPDSDDFLIWRLPRLLDIDELLELEIQPVESDDSEEDIKPAISGCKRIELA